MSRLRFSNEEIEQVSALVLHHMWPIQYRPGDGRQRGARLIRTLGDLRPRILEVARADTRASAFQGVEAIDELSGGRPEPGRGQPGLPGSPAPRRQ